MFGAPTLVPFLACSAAIGATSKVLGSFAGSVKLSAEAWPFLSKSEKVWIVGQVLQQAALSVMAIGTAGIAIGFGLYCHYALLLLYVDCFRFPERRVWLPKDLSPRMGEILAFVVVCPQLMWMIFIARSADTFRVLKEDASALFADGFHQQIDRTVASMARHHFAA